MKAKTIKGYTPTEIQVAFDKSTHDGFKPSLAIIMLSNMEDAEPLRSIFKALGIAIFGITAPKKFTDQGITEGDIIVMLLDIHPDYFKIVLNDYQGSTPYDAGYKTGVVGKSAFTNPGFIISPVNFQMSGDDLIKGLTDAAGKDSAGRDCIVAGGVSGDPNDLSGIVFTTNETSTGGILALIIDHDKVSISGLAVSGWKPVGTTKEITKSEGSWVFTIDHEPAMQIIQKYLGEEIIASTTQASGMLPLELGYPLQFERASGNAIMKPALFYNPADQSIMMAGEVRVGDRFRFSLPPDFDVIDKVVETTAIIKEKEMPDADVLFVFSCVGRLGTFGPLISTEIEGLASTWGKPMIGFFSLGEFGNVDNGRSEWQGTTVSWVALKEN